jgi:hypothetical protein
VVAEVTDASDVDSRLARIYAAIDQTIETDMSGFAPKVEQIGNRISVTQDFMGGRTTAEIENLAHSSIQNIASFPDHLRRWCRQNGVAPSAIDEIYEGSFDLKVIVDLNNNDKHGWPPRDGGKTGIAPQLAEGIETVMQMSTPPGGGFVGFVGFQPVGDPGVTHKVLITGNVSDREGKALGMLHDFQTRALDACEEMWRLVSEKA